MLKLRIMEYHMLLMMLIIGLDVSTSNKVLPPIYWNATNPAFTRKHESVVRHVQIGDKLDVICPIMPHGSRDNDDLYYLTFYAVDEDSFRNCNTKGQKRLMYCNVPKKEKKYTFLFQEITPNPWGLVFEVGKTYYYISTADGTKAGLKQEKGGVCSEKNMRIEIKVVNGNHHDVFSPELEDVRPPKESNPPKPRNPKLIIPDPRILPDNPSFYHESDMDADDDRNDIHINTNNDNILESNDRQNVEIVNGNGLVIGVVLGACAVLFIVLLSFLGYKVYRRRRHDKKYRSPSMTPTRGVGSQGQVTLLPTPGHHQNAVTHLTHHSNGTPVLHMGDYRPPPPYDETERVNMDHAGSTVQV